MESGRVYSVVLRQFYLLRGSVTRMVPLFTWVMIDIILWGFISRYLGSIITGVNTIAVFLGALLLWEFLTRVMFGVTTSFMEDIWSRNFLNIFASPITIHEYMAGMVITSIATSAVGLAAMWALATLVFGLSYAMYGGMFMPFLLVLFVFGISLGIIGSAIMLRLGPSSEWFVWPLPALISPFAGVFYPVSTLPSWMQVVSHWLPPSYVFEGLRTLVSGQQIDPALLMKGFGLAVLYVLVAMIFFARTYRYTVRTGLLARYSAENVS